MSDTEKIKRLLSRCAVAQREEVFRHLRQEFSIHPLEAALHARAEVILQAIERSGELTLRMIRGVIAEAAFEVEVIERLTGWQKIPRKGDPAYDFHLRDADGDVRVQVKLQRSKEKRPMKANEARRSFSANLFVAETQKTRGGKMKATGAATRPYRFGEFDILAVAMYPATNRWDAFMYTVAAWLIPERAGSTEICKYQPVAKAPNDDWTDAFHKAVEWFRAGVTKTIREKES